MGDSLSDLRMISEDKKQQALKIGFLEENVEENKEAFVREFDVVCTDNTSYTELRKILKIW